jgi:hypothetical protein
MVTELLEKAIRVAAELPAKDQDALASLMLEELAAERRWAEVLRSSPEKLRKLADQALDDIRAGRTRELDFDEL